MGRATGSAGVTSDGEVEDSSSGWGVGGGDAGAGSFEVDRAGGDIGSGWLDSSGGG